MVSPTISGRMVERRDQVRITAFWAGPGHADGGAALATAVGVVARVHGAAAHARAPAHEPLAAGTAELDLAVLHVAHLPDGGHAVGEDAAHLAGGGADGSGV